MRSRTFLNVSLGILALAAAYHLGAQSATAQAPGNPVVTGWPGSDALAHVVTANGDVYNRGYDLVFRYSGNVFGGSTPTSTHESFGSLKARYRGEREPQSAKPSTNR